MSWAIQESTEQPPHLRGFQSNFQLKLGASRGSPGGPAEWLSRRRPGSSSYDSDSSAFSAGGKDRELRGAMMPSMEVVYFSGIVTSQMSPLTSALNTALGGVKQVLFVGFNPSLPPCCPPSIPSFFSLPCHLSELRVPWAPFSFPEAISDHCRRAPASSPL